MIVTPPPPPPPLGVEVSEREIAMTARRFVRPESSVHRAGFPTAVGMIQSAPIRVEKCVCMCMRV